MSAFQEWLDRVGAAKIRAAMIVADGDLSIACEQIGASIVTANAILMRDNHRMERDTPQVLTIEPQQSAAAAGVVMSLDLTCRDALDKALEAAGGNRRRAAEMLDVSRSTLYRMMHRYGMLGKEGDGDESEAR